ncbi:MAG TPA: hypothetical protein VLJ68_07565, partial [Chitinophagaceae bacterium]|nr:hypothetical protein [Chitinophagaceae bacterium]
SETYDLLKRGVGYTNDELHELFRDWNKGEMRSFLLEITADVFLQPDPETGQRLVDMILDKAGAKGTGKWTAQEAMDIAVPVPGIDIAVSMRDMSIYKKQRVAAFQLYKPKIRAVPADRPKFIALLHDALACSTLLAYAQGLAMLQKASVELKMEIPVQDVARIWQGGCIIRSAYLELFTSIFKKDPGLENILLHKKVAILVRKKQSALRKVIQRAAAMGIPVGGFMNALTWLDASCAEKLPTNLIQAQRDYFGAHGYQRIDKEGNFHTEWKD